jgi:undecaprenyl-diphosphatase
VKREQPGLVARLAGEVQEGETSSFDNWVLGLFRTAAGELVGPGWLHEAARNITALGSYAVLGLLLLAVVSYLLIARKRFEAASAR